MLTCNTWFHFLQIAFNTITFGHGFGFSRLGKIISLLRYGLKVKLDGSEKEIENAILQHSPEFKKIFRITWGTHRCEVAGCGTWLICDGGMKPHRIVCSARYSGIRSYKHTNIRTVTGCTRKPAKDQKV